MHSARSYGFLAGALLLAAALAGGWREPSFAQTPTPAKPNAAPALHGKKLVEAYCVSCHGVDGNTTADPQYPKLADQKATYLRLQLLAFRSGARKSDIMSGPAHALTDSQIGELARYYSDQPLKADKIENLQLAAIGARIFHRSSRRAPACIACHNRGGPGPAFGPGGMMGGGRGMGHMGGMMGSGHMRMTIGNTAAVPNLYGQHAAYTVKQLEAFAKGTRPGTVMGPISAALSPQDRQAVADYLASLR